MTLLVQLTLFGPLALFFAMGKTVNGPDGFLFLGLVLQAIVGSLIAQTIKPYEGKPGSTLPLWGLALSSLGMGGAYLVGKHFSLVLFWELGSYGSLLMYFGNDALDLKATRGFVALIAVSSLSALALIGWLVAKDPSLGYWFLLVAMLAKSGFFLLHTWLPETQGGTPGHGAALFSGVMDNLPLLLFARYGITEVPDTGLTHTLILICSVGVFYGGLTAFFKSDVKRALGYSTIENMNALWFCLLISGLLRTRGGNDLIPITQIFLGSFVMMMIHHSICKSFQFLTFGYLCKIARSSTLDFCKGIGRFSEIRVSSLFMGTASFNAVPGTTGFIAEALFILSLTHLLGNHRVATAFVVMPTIVLILFGLVLGAAAHWKIFTTMILSLTNEQERRISVNRTHSHAIEKVLVIFSILICVVAVAGGWILDASSVFYGGLPASFLREGGYLALGSSITIAISVILMARFKPRLAIKKRVDWDCGNKHRGTELSIPGSVISDPIYLSLARYALGTNGTSRFDLAIRWCVEQGVGLGRFWIQRVEEATVASYLAFSVIVLLISLVTTIWIKWPAHG